MRANHSSSILPQSKSISAASEPAPRLEMTSLVDMMVILVVFLLMSFSADNQIATASEGLQLPASSSKSSIPQGLIVEVSLDHVMVAGRNVLPSETLADIDQAGLLPLISALKEATKDNAHEKILVQSDRRVQYSSLSQVLRACAEAGLVDVSLVVLGGES